MNPDDMEEGVNQEIDRTKRRVKVYQLEEGT
ncbi:hypothetical protein JOC34_003451 [Virgibacillus halotolerans]|nr:hypothetical protein [Virgibacillus halotolerans]